MTDSRETPKVDFIKIPKNKDVSYEEIRELLLRRHNSEHIGENDIM